MAHQATVILHFSRSDARLFAAVRRLSGRGDRAGLPPECHLCAAVRSASQAWADCVSRRRSFPRIAFRIRRRRGVGTGRRGFDPPVDTRAYPSLMRAPRGLRWRFSTPRGVKAMIKSSVIRPQYRKTAILRLHALGQFAQRILILAQRLGAARPRDARPGRHRVHGCKIAAAELVPSASSDTRRRLGRYSVVDPCTKTRPDRDGRPRGTHKTGRIWSWMRC